MINVICVKWGTKYSAKHVDRLHQMLLNYLYCPFVFYCYTDDPTDVNARIIPIETDLEIYWNKLAMFQKDFVPEGPCLFFDLDIVIQNPINELLDCLSDNLTMVNARWKGKIVTDGNYKKEKQRWDMYANSSVLLWKSNACTHIWDHFMSDPEYYMLQYKGIDRFIFHENMHQVYFPKGMIYSRLYGEYENEIAHCDFALFNKPEKLVCLFNGPTEEWMYEGFEHHWS